MTEFASKKLFPSAQSTDLPLSSPISSVESYGGAALKCLIQFNEIRLDFETYAKSSKTKTVWIVGVLIVAMCIVGLLTYILIKRIKRLGHKEKK